jgi:hypothetical protein
MEKSAGFRICKIIIRDPKKIQRVGLHGIRLRQEASLEHLSILTRLHGITSKKTIIFILSIV